jgi:hypothetical protein
MIWVLFAEKPVALSSTFFCAPSQAKLTGKTRVDPAFAGIAASPRHNVDKERTVLKRLDMAEPFRWFDLNRNCTGCSKASRTI